MSRAGHKTVSQVDDKIDIGREKRRISRNISLDWNSAGAQLPDKLGDVLTLPSEFLTPLTHKAKTQACRVHQT